jgi:hypothetical protein
MAVGLFCCNVSAFDKPKRWVLSKGKVNKKIDQGTAVYILQDVVGSRPKRARTKIHVKWCSSSTLDFATYTVNADKHFTDVTELRTIFNMPNATIEEVFAKHTVHVFEISEVTFIPEHSLLLKGGPRAHSVRSGGVLWLPDAMA